MDESVYPWLLSAEAEPILAEQAEAPPTPAAVAALRKRVDGSAERASAVLELTELRSRAAAKFQHATRMFFSRKSYEQATDQWIARYKAQRFAGFESVVDACCGMGGDLIGLAEVAGRASGIDADPAIAAFAQRNAEVHGVFVAIDSVALTDTNFPACEAWHADPDRRPAGKRTSQPDLHEPSLSTLSAWRAATPAAGIKLAPSARLPDEWERQCELEWISRGGECRQLVAWCGPLARQPGKRAATLVDREGIPVSIVGEADRSVAPASELGRYIHEPDAAVLAAGLVGALAAQHGLEAVSPPLPYLTSDTPAASRLIASFEVIESMPLDRKRLAGWLAERGIGRLEIKCRGVDLRPEKIRRELKPRGDQEVTLLVFPSSVGKVQVVIANRMVPQ